MKRSQINESFAWAKGLVEKHDIRLPDMAYWSMENWKARAGELDTIRETMMGWDITDFGVGDFDTVGAVLYTVRNGSVKRPGVGVPYCEKYILMRDGQRLPKHYHVAKTEDIINRAAGVLAVKLFAVDPATGKETGGKVSVYMDGLLKQFDSGEEILVYPGNSISLAPYIAHIFGPKAGTGDLIVGEVSKVNDDVADNYFLEKTARFADVEEDCPAQCPLCNEYDKL
ncbi:MAG: D-lyxose/D-mannose family sugar isomerase [Clostridia bacterium]